MELSAYVKDKKTHIYGILRKVIVIVFYFLVLEVLARPIAQLLLAINPSVDTDFFTIIMQYVVYIPILIVSIILLKDEIKEGYANISKAKYKHTFMFIGLGLVACYLGNVISSIITSMFSASQDSANQSYIEELFLSKYGILMIVDVCIIGPIVEELVYRSAILNGLKKLKIHPVVAIIISAMIFGFVHVIDAGDYDQVLPYIVMGLVFGFVYHKSKSIFTTISIHVLINSISMSLMLFYAILKAFGYDYGVI